MQWGRNKNTTNCFPRLLICLSQSLKFGGKRGLAKQHNLDRLPESETRLAKIKFPFKIVNCEPLTTASVGRKVEPLGEVKTFETSKMNFWPSRNQNIFSAFDGNSLFRFKFSFHHIFCMFILAFPFLSPLQAHSLKQEILYSDSSLDCSLTRSACPCLLY